ncbi:hypothetical protein COCOBI_03-8700 [Coccomyxa sp. Obi]|nr:hypothetical protein COCOBI_03-8700 [Coccomyxa sp. Obi]
MSPQCCNKAISITVAAEHQCVYRHSVYGRKLQQNAGVQVICNALGDCNDGKDLSVAARTLLDDDNDNDNDSDNDDDDDDDDGDRK